MKQAIQQLLEYLERFEELQAELFEMQYHNKVRDYRLPFSDKELLDKQREIHQAKVNFENQRKLIISIKL